MAGIFQGLPSLPNINFGFGGNFLGNNPPTPTPPTGPTFDWGGIWNTPIDPYAGMKPGDSLTAGTGTGGLIGNLFGLDLLRWVLLLIGIVCIIGAIYLYKPTQEIVAAPVRAARTAVEASAA